MAAQWISEWSRSGVFAKLLLWKWSIIGEVKWCNPFPFSHYWALSCLNGFSAVLTPTLQLMHNTNASWKHGNSCLNQAPNLINTTMRNQPDRKGLCCTSFGSAHSLRKCYDNTSLFSDRIGNLTPSWIPGESNNRSVAHSVELGQP